MEQKDCVREIREKLEEIVGIYHRYNPEGKYLALSYSDGWILFNNRYWEEDKNRAINFTEEEGEIAE